MSGHKPWSELSVKLRANPERRARIKQREQDIGAELTISQLREVRDATQENVAERMNVTQSNVSHFRSTNWTAGMWQLTLPGVKKS